jgi:hypothetical protein
LSSETGAADMTEAASVRKRIIWSHHMKLAPRLIREGKRIIPSQFRSLDWATYGNSRQDLAGIAVERTG